MEEKGQPSLTIGDILDQLTKPSILQSPGAVSPGSNTPQTPPAPPQKPPTGSGFNLPSLGGNKPEQSSSTGQDSSGQAMPTEIGLSIRTMSEDLAKLKQGQKPLPTTITRPIGPQTPIKAPPIPRPIPKIELPPIDIPRQIPRTPAPQPVLPPRQAPLNQDFRPPIIPRSEAPIAKLPSLKELSQKGESEHFHQEKVISRGESGTDTSLPEYLGAPVPKKKVAKPEDEKVEYGLIARIISKGLTTGIISTIILAIVAYFAIYYLVFNREQIFGPSPTPTPVATPTPTPLTSELISIFGNVSIVNFNLPVNRSEAASTLRTFIQSQPLEKGQFRQLSILDQAAPITKFDNLLDVLSIHYPPELKNELSGNMMLLIYGQSELFNGTEQSPKRVTLIAEIKNIASTNEVMKSWESTMPNDFMILLDLDPSKRASSVFLDNEHHGVMIRYMNFPLPDKSIDYALITSLTGRYYLIISDSRESMYSPADRIQGL